MLQHNSKVFGLMFMGFILSQCSKHTPVESRVPIMAEAVLEARSNSKVKGNILFLQVNEKQIQIKGAITGLTPDSKHGFHIHEKGDCSAADGSSAGGHFNPEGVDHGPLDSEKSHAGDLGNIQAGANGIAEFEIFKSGVSLTDQITSFIGRAVILHEKNDDLTSQPTGNAGGRIACGLVMKK